MARKKGSPHKAKLEGDRFHRLIVKERIYGSTWLCVCDCGQEVKAQTYSLKAGKVKSCGCYSRDRTRTHGMEGTPTYNTWAHMLSRCRNTKHKQYADYGGRGITVCDRWLKFENFMADMGEKPDGLSLDRIDNNGPYNHDNCRWTTQHQQVSNRRVTPKYRGDGGNMYSLTQLAEQAGLPWRRVYDRVRSGWDIDKALNTPIRKKSME